MIGKASAVGLGARDDTGLMLRDGAEALEILMGHGGEVALMGGYRAAAVHNPGYGAPTQAVREFQ